MDTQVYPEKEKKMEASFSNDGGVNMADLSAKLLLPAQKNGCTFLII